LRAGGRKTAGSFLSRRPGVTSSRDVGESGDRRLGALLGLAIGDALGTTLEFTAPHAPAFPELAAGPHTDITGGGPFGVAPGQVTDDTQMACALFTRLISGKTDASSIADAYVEWSHVAFDIGNQTESALGLIEQGKSSLVAGKIAWSGTKAGNGSLMRTTPIGVMAPSDERCSLSLIDSAITHFDPRCRLACAAHNAAVGAAVAGGDPKQMIDAARDELGGAAMEISADYDAYVVETAVASLTTDLALAEEDDPRLYGPELHLHAHQGFVRVAFRLAFWELLHASTFAAAVIDAANRGGDADTNAAITGALYGALVGAEALPRKWRDLVLTAKPKHHAKLASAYHPRIFAQQLA